MTTEADPFDVFQTTDEVMAWVYRETGAEGLREYLQMMVLEPQATPSILLKAAAELEAAGLMKAAAMVTEAVATIPEPECPFPEGSANGRDWLRRHHHAGGDVPDDQQWWQVK
jgi:hypothetical protein